MTDRRTDRHPRKNNMSPDPKGGRHNNLILIGVYDGKFKTVQPGVRYIFDFSLKLSYLVKL